MSRQIEMVWRCSTCQHQNLGRHKLCQGCGNPKDASEHYEMPGDTSAAESVTDPELLKLANAGVNWQCAFCGSHQRRFDGVCAQCGAGQAEGRDAETLNAETLNAPASSSQSLSPQSPSPKNLAARLRARWKSGALLAAVLSCCGLSGLGGLLGVGQGARHDLPKTHFVAEVVARSWERVVTVERYQYLAQEGFAENIPADAQERTPLGQRHHHNEQVPDGFDTEHYTVRVQDGYDTEHYSERVACGQDCVSSPQSCREVCSPNGNGFATCSQVCSGGGQTCSTRYCNETRTRQVPRYRNDPRTRQVQRYRTVSRRAEWYGYRVWRWRTQRVLRAEGQAAEPPRWPSAEEIQLGQELGEGEREREQRSETYTVRLLAQSREFTSRPANEDAYNALPLRSLHFVRAPPGAGFTLEERLATP